MKCPILVSVIMLALLDSMTRATEQTQEEAVEVLNAIPYDEIEEDERQHSSTDEDYISDLWSDIENAFKFLEERNVENELRRLRMTEISKRLPRRRHNFVRFGKRYQPSHSFVRFGRSAPSSPPEESTSLPVEEIDAEAAPLSLLYLLQLSGQKEEEDALGKRQKSKNPNNFVRIGRSTDSTPTAFNPDTYDADGSAFTSLLKRKLPSVVRIGKLPASLYRRQPSQQQQQSPAKSSAPGKQAINTLPRYG